MTGTPSFSDLLSRPVDSIERPKPLPAGTYYGFIKGHELGKSTQKQTPYVRFHLGVREAGEDVEANAVDGIDLTKKQLRRDYFLTEDALYRLKNLLESLGIESEGRSLGECIPETTGAEVMIGVKQRQSQEGQSQGEIFNEVSDLAGASSS